MYVPYDDILRRISEPPLWWFSGVPRYGAFRPGDMNVYAEAALLLKAQCQGCARQFLVGVPGSVRQLIAHGGEQIGSWSDDPPHHDDASLMGSEDPRCVGNTMTMEVLEVVEAWWRAPMEVHPRDGKTFAYLGAWTRQPHIEGWKG